VPLTTLLNVKKEFLVTKFIQQYFRDEDFDDILSDSLKILWICRYHPALNPWWTTVLMPYVSALSSLFAGLAIKGILVSYKDDLSFAAECLQTFIIVLHVSKKKDMNKLIHRKIFRGLSSKLSYTNIKTP
jgi:hypothetical protein